MTDLKLPLRVEDRNDDALYLVDAEGTTVACILDGEEWAIAICEAVNASRDVAALKREIEILRQYGNKDCTAMADAALRDEKEK